MNFLRVVAGFALVALACVACADPPAYSAREIRGQVVDDVTGEPLADVNVVARWVLIRETIPGVLHQAYNDPLKVLETVTGRDGRFAFAAWGPVRRPALRHLANEDPVLLFFRSGYYPLSLSNELRTNHNRDATRVSEWDGRTVRLRRFTGEAQEYTLQDGRFKQDVKVRGTLGEYAMKVRGLQDRLNWFNPSDEWQKYPRMLAALREERARLEKAGLDPGYQIGRVSELHGGAAAVDRFIGSPKQ